MTTARHGVHDWRVDLEIPGHVCGGDFCPVCADVPERERRYEQSL